MENSNATQIEKFTQGLKGGLPIVVGYWAVGFACGAIGVASNFTFWQIAALGFFMNSGSAHFLLYSLVSSGAGPLAVGLGVAFINLRYVLISTYMAQYFSKYTKFQKFLSGLLLTDEGFGVSTAHAKKNNLKDLPFLWYLGVSLMAWANWWLACMAGALLASQLPEWIKNSLAFSLSGMFIGLVIVALQASKTKFIDVIVMIASVVIMVLFHGSVSDHLIILLSCIIAATAGLIIYLKFNKEKS